MTYAEGFKDGYQEGREESKAERIELMNQLHDSWIENADLKRLYDNLLDDWTCLFTDKLTERRKRIAEQEELRDKIDSPHYPQPIAFVELD